jgi:hypothetical protein
MRSKSTFVLSFLVAACALIVASHAVARPHKIEIGIGAAGLMNGTFMGTVPDDQKHLDYKGQTVGDLTYPGFWGLGGGGGVQLNAMYKGAIGMELDLLYSHDNGHRQDHGERPGVPPHTLAGRVPHPLAGQGRHPPQERAAVPAHRAGVRSARRPRGRERLRHGPDQILRLGRSLHQPAGRLRLRVRPAGVRRGSAHPPVVPLQRQLRHRRRPEGPHGHRRRGERRRPWCSSPSPTAASGSTRRSSRSVSPGTSTSTERPPPPWTRFSTSST